MATRTQHLSMSLFALLLLSSSTLGSDSPHQNSSPPRSAVSPATKVSPSSSASRRVSSSFPHTGTGGVLHRPSASDRLLAPSSFPSPLSSSSSPALSSTSTSISTSTITGTSCSTSTTPTLTEATREAAVAERRASDRETQQLLVDEMKHRSTTPLPQGCTRAHELTLCPAQCDNGICVGVNCMCEPGYTGPTCNVTTHSCNTTLCFNGGLCVTELLHPQPFCRCLAPWSGALCTDIVLDTDNPSVTLGGPDLNSFATSLSVCSGCNLFVRTCSLFLQEEDTPTHSLFLLLSSQILLSALYAICVCVCVCVWAGVGKSYEEVVCVSLSLFSCSS
jgi:hypothetical protein